VTLSGLETGELDNVRASLSLSLSLSLGHFPDELGLVGGPVFIEAKDDGGGGDSWSCKSCKAPVKSMAIKLDERKKITVSITPLALAKIL